MCYNLKLFDTPFKIAKFSSVFRRTKKKKYENQSTYLYFLKQNYGEKMENDNSRDNKSQEIQKDKKLIDKKNKNKAKINEMRRKYFDYYDDVKTNIKEDW